jgi:hypothetical protein
MPPLLCPYVPSHLLCSIKKFIPYSTNQGIRKVKRGIVRKLIPCLPTSQRRTVTVGGTNYLSHVIDLNKVKHSVILYGKVVSALNQAPRCEDVTPPPYPLDRKMGGPQGWSGRGGKEKNSLSCPCRESHPGALSLY